MGDFNPSPRKREQVMPIELQYSYHPHTIITLSSKNYK